MTKALAVGWARDGIQVNAILPGAIRTEMSAAGHQNEEATQRIAARTPAGRWGKPEDLAGAAVFLASPASNFVTGHALVVDGGYVVMP